MRVKFFPRNIRRGYPAARFRFLVKFGDVVGPELRLRVHDVADVGQFADFVAPSRNHRLAGAHVLRNIGVAVSSDVEVLISQTAPHVGGLALDPFGLRLVPMQRQVALHHLVCGFEDGGVLRVILVRVKCHFVPYSLIPAASAAARPISYNLKSLERSFRSGIPHFSRRSKCSCICFRLNWVVILIPSSIFSFLRQTPDKIMKDYVSSVAAAPAIEQYSASSRCACRTSRFSRKCSSTYVKCCMP